jgi:superfamily II DNA helicase RecQ
MPLIFFTIPTLHPEPSASELNQCLATQRVAQVEKSFVADGAASHWAVCVTLVDAQGDRPGLRGDANRRRGAVDYRELLSAEEFALYDRLRSARKQAAEADGLPTYAVFTNEQLAAMVRGRVNSAAALAGIDGVGDGRVARYGPAFLPMLCEGVARMSAPASPASLAPPANPAWQSAQVDA